MIKNTSVTAVLTSSIIPWCLHFIQCAVLTCCSVYCSCEHNWRICRVDIYPQQHVYVNVNSPASIVPTICSAKLRPGSCGICWSRQNKLVHHDRQSGAAISTAALRQAGSGPLCVLFALGFPPADQEHTDRLIGASKWDDCLLSPCDWLLTGPECSLAVVQCHLPIDTGSPWPCAGGMSGKR